MLFRVISWIAFDPGEEHDPRNHIYEEVVGVKGKVKTHFTTNAAAPFLFY
ncbi:MAG TPA: hypothetical protein VGP85_18270 [Pyrinomonadaceae bacterium]|nr:hypothetical protein [Pyrinomonadaceae bacterium]